MTTPIVPSVTDELIAELEAAANAATPGPWEHLRINDISWVASEEWEILDLRCDKPLDAEDGEYIAQANPATILALLAHIAELKLQLAAASVDAERYRFLRGRLPGSAYRIAGVIYSEGGEGVDAAIDAARNIAGGD